MFQGDEYVTADYSQMISTDEASGKYPVSTQVQICCWMVCC